VLRNFFLGEGEVKGVSIFNIERTPMLRHKDRVKESDDKTHFIFNSPLAVN
jgi:hypothetical protein